MTSKPLISRFILLWFPILVCTLVLSPPKGNASFQSAVQGRLLNHLPNTFWDLSFWVTPGGDGTSLFVFTGPTTELSANVEATLQVGPGPEVSIGMTFDEESGAYEVLVSEIITPGSETVNGTIALSATLNNTTTLNTGQISFRRFFVPTSNAPPLISTDNRLEVTINDDSLPTDAYAVIMQTNALPAPPPPGYQLVAPPYTLRASGANPESDKNMVLSMFYGDLTLEDISTRTLRLMQWKDGSWQDLGGKLDDLFNETVSTTTKDFTVYALMSAPSWYDSFYNFNGLADWENTITLLPEGGLALDGLSLSGFAVSDPITPTLPIESWGTIGFTHSLPPGTTLTVDILDIEGNVIMSNLASGTSLSALHPASFPSLQLRATFTTTDPKQSARLEFWQLSWNTETHQVFLPIIAQQD